MIKSMTAFSRGEGKTPWGVLSWEVRTVNHRFCDISLRLPDDLRGLEPVVREQVARRVKRGKVDCALKFQPVTGADNQIALNEELLAALLQASRRVAAMMEQAAPASALEFLKWPGVMEVNNADNEQLRQEAARLLERCLDELQENRLREGAQMKTLIEQRCQAMLDQVRQVRERLPEIMAHHRQRLQARVDELKSEMDSARFEQELMLIAQKIDIQEELDRIDVHVEEVCRVLGQDEPVGRRLDFLMQELNREANTLGSKSVDTATTRAAVEMKVLIEQMREQIQNIE